MTLREYHERTKHSLASIRASPTVLDWENQPLPFKVYSDLEPAALPSDLPGSQHPALSAIAGIAAPESRAIDLAVLAHLLFFSAGVMRRRSYAGGTVYYRAAACTGALYHVDAYVVCGDLAGLAAGVHHFGPHDFALRTLRRGDHRAHLVAATADDPATARAPMSIVLTSTFWRNAWKYRDRTYRHCFWDAGTLLANLLADAAALGVGAEVIMGFVDDDVARLLDLDQQREVPLAIVALGADAVSAPLGPDDVPAAPPLSGLGFSTVPLSRTEIDYPLVRAAHVASALATPEAVRAWRAAGDETPAPPAVRCELSLPPLDLASAAPEPLEPVIARRGSTRRFPREPITADQLATICHVATRPVPLDVAAPVELFVIVHAVDGVVAGTYRAGPDGHTFERLQTGDLRNVAGFLDLGQALAADAAVNLYWLADLDATFARLGERGYRAAQLAAAIAGGRAYLAAYALDLGATGLTFFDDDVTRFLTPSAPGMGVMFLVAIGKRGGARTHPEAVTNPRS
jgi:SagB-type dehydrogenase family enzyme